MANIKFLKRLSVEQVEESQDLAPKFGSDGVIACITKQINVA